MFILNLLMGMNSNVRYTFAMFNVSSKERDVVGLANACNKGVLNANVHTLAFQGVVNSGCLSGCSLIERYDGDIFKKSAYQIYLPALLDPIKKLVQGYRSYVDPIFEICLFKKICTRLAFF